MRPYFIFKTKREREMKEVLSEALVTATHCDELAYEPVAQFEEVVATARRELSAGNLTPPSEGNVAPWEPVLLKLSQWLGCTPKEAGIVGVLTTGHFILTCLLWFS